MPANRMLFILGVLSASGIARAGTLHVPSEVPTIQAALDAATSSDTILVEPGTYETSAPFTFGGKDLALVSVDGPATTVLRMGASPASADRASVIVFETGETEAARVEGFTITGGAGSRWGPGSSESGGGGVLSRNGSRPSLARCVITGNRARNGGGLMVDVGSGIQLRDSTVRLNQASGMGGGVLFVGSLPSAAVEGCLVESNLSASGGGMFFFDGGKATIAGTRLIGNYADSVGGAVCCLIDGTPRFEACTFMGNTAFGAGVLSCETGSDSPVLVNCLIAGNFAFVAGAIQARSGAAPEFRNCTISGNAADDEGGFLCAGGVPILINTICAENAPDSICGDLTSCLTDGSPRFVSQGTFDFNRYRTVEIGGFQAQVPDFVIDAGDYRLQPGSLAVDKGTSDGAPAVDIGGQARPCGDAVDIGAYERCAAPAGSFIRGDANADARVDLSDSVFILSFLFSGGRAPTCMKSADTDDAGSLEITDGIFLLNFLFVGTKAPPPPFESCGLDSTGDDLPCDSHAPCGA